MREEKIIVSIIVLNYNGERILPKLVKSLDKLTFSKDRLEVFIVDNASTDRSKKYLEKITHKKNWQIIFSHKNLGFAGGNNLAIKKARGHYVILLNNDCLVATDWLEKLVNCADNNQTAFSINSKIILDKYEDRLAKKKIQNIGTMVFQDGYGRDIGASVSNHQQSYEEDHGQFDQVKSVYSTCGAAVLYNKKILDKIARDGLDETFFMYYEDVALSEKATILGYKNLSCPQAKVYHRHAQSSGEWSPFFIFHVEKGRLLHMYYNFPKPIWFKEWCKFAMKTLAKLGLSFLKDRDLKKEIKVNLEVVADFFTNYFSYRKNKYQNYYSHKNWSTLVEKNYQEILSGKWYFN